MAHELGHTFGRLHVPDDSEYPYGPTYLTPERETWSIGAHGYDVVDGVLRSPTVYADIEGGDPKWISDYTYRGILEFREREAQAAARQVGTGPNAFCSSADGPQATRWCSTRPSSWSRLPRRPRRASIRSKARGRPADTRARLPSDRRQP